MSDLEASKTNVNFTMTACAACTMTSDTDEGMVGCDGCNNWYHYRCVGVDEKEIQKQEKWFCPTEGCQKMETDLAKKLVENRKKGSKGRKMLGVDDVSDKSSSKSDRQTGTGSSFEKKMKALEKEQRAKEKEIEEERQLWEKKMAMERILKEKRMQMETEMRKREMAQEKELLEKALREQQEHVDQMERMRERYQAKMAEVKKQLSVSGMQAEFSKKLALLEKPEEGLTGIGRVKKTKKPEPEEKEEEQESDSDSNTEESDSSSTADEVEEEESVSSDEESDEATEEESNEDEKKEKQKEEAACTITRAGAPPSGANEDATSSTERYFQETSRFLWET